MSKYAFVLSVSGIVLLLDQITKWYIRHTVSLYESITVVDSVFQITHVRNSGGAFGLFARANGVPRVPLFMIVSVGAVVFLLYFVRGLDPTRRVLLFAIGQILGGALGNFVDRLIAGGVTDFLDLQWHGYHWPAFNVADSCITIGTLIMFCSLWAVDGHVGERQRQ